MSYNAGILRECSVFIPFIEYCIRFPTKLFLLAHKILLQANLTENIFYFTYSFFIFGSYNVEMCYICIICEIFCNNVEFINLKNLTPKT